MLNCNNKLGCIHLHQNKVPDYFHYLSGKINNTKHIFFVASYWPQHVGVDKYKSVPELTRLGTITLLNSHLISLLSITGTLNKWNFPCGPLEVPVNEIPLYSAFF